MDTQKLPNELERLGISATLLDARGLHPFAEAERLEVVQTDADGRRHSLTPEAASAWQRMYRAARKDDVILLVVSAFRSVERQIRIVRRKLDAGQTLEEILAVNAPPGYSEHHTGRAVDIGTPNEPLLESSFSRTNAYDWLRRHGNEFGFVLSYPQGNAAGYRYEPWHWCYHSDERSS